MRKKILLVDDAATILMMEKRYLSRGPFEIVTARDGVEAVEKARSEKPDLILMDIVMPRMTGLDACRRIREIEETKGIPIIMVTSRGDEANIQTGYENGCTDYITKPINSTELMAKIRSILSL